MRRDKMIIEKRGRERDTNGTWPRRTECIQGSRPSYLRLMENSLLYLIFHIMFMAGMESRNNETKTTDEHVLFSLFVLSTLFILYL